MAAPPCPFLSLPRELRDSIYEFAATDVLPIDICATGDYQSEAAECTAALGATCRQVRTEAYERFYWNNTFVVYLKANEDPIGLNPNLLRRFRRVVIEPYFDEIPPVVVSRVGREWKVEEWLESFEVDEWMSLVKEDNLEVTLREVTAILGEEAGNGLTLECVEKIRLAQESILKKRALEMTEEIEES